MTQEAPKLTTETRSRIDPEGALSTPAVADKLASLRAIDTDVHNDLPSYADLKPFLASKWHDTSVSSITNHRV